jgi:hypothetical protein
VTYNPNNEDETVATEERNIIAHESPLPELTDAYSRLAPAFCEILELGSEYATGLNVFRMSVSTTKAGTRSVKMFATKQLESRSDYLHRMDCPFVQIDPPADGESGSVEVTNKAHLELIMDALTEAERYAAGERSQTTLGFDDAVTGINALAEKGRNADEGQGEFVDFAAAKKNRKAN